MLRRGVHLGATSSSSSPSSKSTKVLRRKKSKPLLDRTVTSLRRAVSSSDYMPLAGVFMVTFVSFVVLYKVTSAVSWRLQHHHKSGLHSFSSSLTHTGNAAVDDLEVLPWNRIYTVPNSMSVVGDRSDHYVTLRQSVDAVLAQEMPLLLQTVQESQLSYTARPMDMHHSDQVPYDIYDCPELPPAGYPFSWHTVDLLRHWPADETVPPMTTNDDGNNAAGLIHQSLCVFDYTKTADYNKAILYRDAMLPFVVVNDPAVLETVARWNRPGYMEQLMGNVPHRTEYSENNHFMYFVPPTKHQKPKTAKQAQEARGLARGLRNHGRRRLTNRDDDGDDKTNGDDGKAHGDDGKGHAHGDDAPQPQRRRQRAAGHGNGHDDEPPKRRVSGGGRHHFEAPPGWTAPTQMKRMPYKEWLAHASVSDETLLQPNRPHWYYRLIGCGLMGNDGSCDAGSSEFLYDELPFFQPRNNLYIVEPAEQKGIHCRFGMKGVIAENHFDSSRNAIALLKGSRRYILSHPNQCGNLSLYPKGHPSARHSAVDWSRPDLEKYPEFGEALSNEVVLQPGQVLYLPTNWFHFIVSLELNFQCNARSGVEAELMKHVRACGF